MADNSNPFMGGPVDIPDGPRRYGRPRRRFPFKKIILIILGLAIIGVLAWKFIPSKNEQPKSAAKTETDTSAPQAQTSSGITDVPPAGELKTYKGDFPRLEFKYPSNWTVTAADNGIRIESPGFTYRLADGMTTSGNFRIYIRQGARTVDSKYIARGVATQPSEKLTYTEPVTGQRPETNLSFFGLDTPDAFAYFFIAGNFSLQKGDTLGPDYGKEAETYIISGGYSAKSLTDDLATNQVPLDYFQTTNAYKQAIDIIKSLKLL
jgi:hypothetical protein